MCAAGAKGPAGFVASPKQLIALPVVVSVCIHLPLKHVGALVLAVAVPSLASRDMSLPVNHIWRMQALWSLSPSTSYWA